MCSTEGRSGIIAHGFLETNQRESINIISSFGFAIPYDHPEPELSVGNPSSVFIMMKTRSRAHSHEQLREPPPCFPALAAGLHTMHLSCLYHSCGNLPISSKLRHFGEWKECFSGSTGMAWYELEQWFGLCGRSKHAWSLRIHSPKSAKDSIVVESAPDSMSQLWLFSHVKMSQKCTHFSGEIRRNFLSFFSFSMICLPATCEIPYVAWYLKRNWCFLFSHLNYNTSDFPKEVYTKINCKIDYTTILSQSTDENSG